MEKLKKEEITEDTLGLWNEEDVESTWKTEKGTCNITIQISDGFDRELENLIQQFKGLLYALGYQKETIEESFK